MPDTVTIDTQTAAWLVAGALTDLWMADQDVDEQHGGGCCPVCCAPCGALKRLLDAGQLDEIVRPYYEENDSYMWVDGRVDREFLTRAWRLQDCAEYHGEVDGGVVPGQ